MFSSATIDTYIICNTVIHHAVLYTRRHLILQYHHAIQVGMQHLGTKILILRNHCSINLIRYIIIAQ